MICAGFTFTELISRIVGVWRQIYAPIAATVSRQGADRNRQHHRHAALKRGHPRQTVPSLTAGSGEDVEPRRQMLPSAARKAPKPISRVSLRSLTPPASPGTAPAAMRLTDHSLFITTLSWQDNGGDRRSLPRNRLVVQPARGLLVVRVMVFAFRSTIWSWSAS